MGKISSINISASNVPLTFNCLPKKGRTQYFGIIKTDILCPQNIKFKPSFLNNKVKKRPHSSNFHKNSLKLKKKSKSTEMKNALLEDDNLAIRNILKGRGKLSYNNWGKLYYLDQFRSLIYSCSSEVKLILSEGNA